MKTKDMCYVGILCALASVLGYVESIIPPFVPVQGFKIGLANIAVMFTLYKLGIKYAVFVMLVKVLVTSLWFAAPSTFIYSAFGAGLALLAMWGCKRLKLSEIGVGISGGVFHNIGQLLAASVVLKTTSTLYLAVLLLPFGLISGAAVGFVVKLLLKYIK